MLGPLVALALAPTAHAGAWTQPPGHHYVKVWSRTLVGSGIFTDTGDIADLDASFVDTNLQAYGELGLTDHITAVASTTALGFATHRDDGTAYLGPTLVGARLGGRLGSLRVAGELRAGGTPPVGDRPLGGPGQTEAGPYVYQPAVAGARAEGEAQLGGPLRFGWWVVAPGVRAQTADVVPLAFTTFAQLGWSVSERWTTDLHVSVLEPLSPAQDPGVVNAAGTGWTRYQGVGLAASRWLDPQWGLTFAAEGVVGAMSNAATPTLVLGVEHRTR